MDVTIGSATEVLDKEIKDGRIIGLKKHEGEMAKVVVLESKDSKLMNRYFKFMANLKAERDTVPMPELAAPYADFLKLVGDLMQPVGKWTDEQAADALMTIYNGFKQLKMQPMTWNDWFFARFEREVLA